MDNITKFIKPSSLMTISNEQIEKINKRLPEFHRASAIIGHSTSQTSCSLQTMNMISDSPLSRMKQCISQINKKYSALQEAYYRIENLKLDIQKLLEDNTQKSKLKVREHEATINKTSILMENSFRQLGMFQDMYDAIKKNNNIPDDWTEKDYENQEIEHMIKSAFRLAIQDLTATGRVSAACVEWWEQLGIHPQTGEVITRGYMIKMKQKIDSKDLPLIEDMYKFLDEMAEQFKDVHKSALKRMGLDELGSSEFMAEGVTKPQ